MSVNLEDDSPRPAVGVQKHFLISLHGITTTGKWQKDLQECCDDAGLQHRPFDFGWFGFIQFVLPFLRQRKVQWFRDEYQKLVSKEQLDHSPPSIIAHSFGTYIVARAMESFHEIRFRRMILCGSIINRDYDWDATIGRGQVERMLNEFGRKDIWVRLAEWILVDGGSSGYQGFDHIAGGAVVQRRHAHWRHSDYFFKLNYERNWIPFLVGKKDPTSGKENRTGKPNWRFILLICTALLATASVLVPVPATLKAAGDWLTRMMDSKLSALNFLSRTRELLELSQSDYRELEKSKWYRSPQDRDVLSFPVTLAKLEGQLQVEFDGPVVNAIFFTARGDKLLSREGAGDNCDPSAWASAELDFRTRYGVPIVVPDQALDAKSVFDIEADRPLIKECTISLNCNFIPHEPLLRQSYEFHSKDGSKWQVQRTLLHYSLVLSGNTPRRLDVNNCLFVFKATKR